MRICLAIVAFLGAVVVSFGASAASFDCSKAATDVEKAICGYPDLSAADEVLATAWATAIGGLSKDAVVRMREGQRAWLDFARYACIDNSDDETVEGRGQCLLSEFNDRIKTLEGSRMLGGHRFYLVTGNSGEIDPDYDASSAWHVASHAFAYPQIDADTSMARSFNALMAGLRGDGGDDQSSNASSDTDLNVTLEDVLPARITVTLNDFWYGHGAAHGNYGISHVHYLVGDEREMEAADLFAGENWQQQLGDLAIAALKAEHGDALFESFEDDVRAVVADPNRWIFRDYGLGLQFQPYEVSAYAYGAPTATVSWDDLDGLLSEKGQNLRWGY